MKISKLNMTTYSYRLTSDKNKHTNTKYMYMYMYLIYHTYVDNCNKIDTISFIKYKDRKKESMK